MRGEHPVASDHAVDVHRAVPLRIVPEEPAVEVEVPLEILEARTSGGRAQALQGALVDLEGGGDLMEVLVPRVRVDPQELPVVERRLREVPRVHLPIGTVGVEEERPGAGAFALGPLVVV